MSDDRVLATAVGHLARLSGDAIQIRPYKLGCFSEEMPNAGDIGRSIDVLTKVAVATYVYGGYGGRYIQ
jgi:hypothetical protein